MPGFDGTGPWGAGPGTGWGLGPCGAGWRRGFGRFRGWWGFGRGGRGFGRFCWWGRRWFGPFGFGGAAPYGAPPNELEALKEEEAFLKSQLEEVQKRLAELERSQT